MSIIDQNLFLTKEAFEQHVKRIRERQAKQYGMTLEEWDAAAINMQVVTPVSGSSE